MAKLFANSGDPDQMLCSAVTDLGLHCLLITFLGVARLHWVNKYFQLYVSVMQGTQEQIALWISTRHQLLFLCHKISTQPTYQLQP